MKLEYRTIDAAEMKPDLYAGESCDNYRPTWVVSIPKQGEERLSGNLELDPHHYPAGTRILIEVPVCPDCDLDAEYKDINGKCECGFDWTAWANNQYS